MNDEKLEIRVGDIVELDLWRTLEQGLVIDKRGDTIIVHQSNRDLPTRMHTRFVTRIVLRREFVKDFWIYLGREK